MDVNLIETLSFKNGVLTALFTYIGLLRFIMKPTMSLLLNVSKITKNRFDDRLYVSIRKSRWYNITLYILDWFASFKVVK